MGILRWTGRSRDVPRTREARLWKAVAELYENSFYEAVEQLPDDVDLRARAKLAKGLAELAVMVHRREI